MNRFARTLPEENAQGRDQSKNETQRNNRQEEDQINLRWETVRYAELPRWLQDNDYLQAGHRPPLNSFRACFWSIFRLHSETGNIWLHLLGSLWIIVIASKFLLFDNFLTDQRDRDILIVVFVSGILCFGASACSHIFSCHSPSVFETFIKADYICITLHVTASELAWIYYMFYDSYRAKAYYCGIVLLLGVATTNISLWEKFSHPDYRQLRAYVFITFGCFVLIPLCHWLYRERILDHPELTKAGTYLLLELLLALAGVLLYANRIPERFFPGSCDYWFQSHQFYHILVVSASLTQCYGLFTLAGFRQRMKLTFTTAIHTERG